ncbi:unnamed protein product [Arctia plantaginis]|uniref:Dynein regulatory complex protein 9 n=1 Tax=Arctia plantaginis TaxID=874455 RepID=A0A8S1ATT9_ARCPL|nr:unnamed protein product [Arctia plantaginis]
MDCSKTINSWELIRQHEYHLSLSDITEEDHESEFSGIFGESSLILRGMLCVVLEDIKLQLQCLKGYNNKIQTDIRDINLPDSLDELVELKEKISESTLLYAKLDADREYVYDVIQNTYWELREQSTFSYLKESVHRFVQNENDRCDLVKDKERNKIIRKNLAKQLRLQRCHFKVQLHDINGAVENLERTIDDAQPMFEVKGRYIDNWQVARTEQHSLKIANKENIPRLSINRFRQKYEHEEQVHCEILRLTTIQITEILSQIEVIMDKYDKDLENIELQIQIRKNKYYDMCNKKMDMEQMLEKRDATMKNWIKFKEDREIVRLYNEKMTNAAYIIQAWWRGLLVRLHLGPYAVKKEKKKKQKKIRI